MIYIFDSDTLINLFRYYYRNSFPSLWDKFDQAISEKSVLSVREVSNEIEQYDDHLSEWAKKNCDFFQPPVSEELVFVAEIFAVPKFQSLVHTKKRLQGKPVADPFVIAKAKVLKGCVVTEEVKKPNASRIPNVCEHFNVACLNLKGFMEQEHWTF